MSMYTYIYIMRIYIYICISIWACAIQAVLRKVNMGNGYSIDAIPIRILPGR